MKTSKTISLKKNDKVLIISDLHLTTKFDKKRYQYLKKIIGKATKVIINGDFWEGYACSFDEFVNSEWKKLFPLLKKKQTIYIFGNHDLKKWSDERRKLFSSWSGDKIIIKNKKTEYIIMHGHEYIPVISNHFPCLEKNAKLLRKYSLIRKIIKVDSLGIKIAGLNYLRWAYKALNKKLKNYKRNKLNNNQFLITGHVHYGELDKRANYANCGVNVGNICQYLELSSDNLIFKSKWL